MRSRAGDGSIENGVAININGKPHANGAHEPSRLPRRTSAFCVLRPLTLLLALLLLVALCSWLTLQTSDVRLGRAATAELQSLPPPPDEWASASHLIVVAGHAVYSAASHSAEAVRSEDSWQLESFQRGQLSTMLKHIEKGVALAAADNNSLLLFSGGETRPEAGPKSEALSYYEAAEALGWFGHPHVRRRAVLEDHARDSLENLLFSLCRFREASERYPYKVRETPARDHLYLSILLYLSPSLCRTLHLSPSPQVTVVSFGFKRRRFTDLHRKALRFPRHRFHYEGIDPPGLPLAALAGETEHSAKPFESDPYGCARDELRRKRSRRNPFRRALGVGEGCPELRGVLRHCGAGIYDGELPWHVIQPLSKQ